VIDETLGAALKQILLYLPVIHTGYEAFLEQHQDADEVLLLGTSFAEEFAVLRKEIRALAPERAATYLRWAGDRQVRIIERDQLPEAVIADVLVVPDEQLMRDLVDKHELNNERQVVFDRTFLRWDRAWSTAIDRPAEFDGTVSTDQLSIEMAWLTVEEAQRSSDWWRQVGAVAVREGQVIDKAHNEHKPSEYSPYLNGDPRNDFSRGLRADLSTALHAEAAIVARAARDGRSLAGAEIYVSTFPCPACARLIAEAGFKRCYFVGQYAVLDGDAILRAAGVELIWVDVSPGADRSS
jgi:dCMP deaminase